MPIRIEHQPSAGVVGMAAYYTGARGAKLRQQKYAIDAAQQNQAIQARREGQFMDFKYNQELNRQRNIEIGARDTKLHDWDVSTADARRKAEREDETSRRKFETDSEAERRKFETERDKMNRERSMDDSIAMGIASGELMPTELAQKELEVADKKYNDAVASKLYNEEQLAKYRSDLDEWKKSRLRNGGVRKPDGITEFGKTAVVRDASAPNGIRKAKPGEMPTDNVGPDGKLVPIGPSEQQQREAVKKQAEQEARQKTQENRQKQREKLEDREFKLRTTVGMKPTEKDTLLTGIEQKRESLDVDELLEDQSTVAKMSNAYMNMYGVAPSRDQLRDFATQYLRSRKAAPTSPAKPATQPTTQPAGAPAKPATPSGTVPSMTPGAPAATQPTSQNPAQALESIVTAARGGDPAARKFLESKGVSWEE